jgi:hypothetical protein
MQDIEPFYNWRSFYCSEDDELSPFYGAEHSEFEYTNHIYNYVIHPQWDDMGSETLFIKILYANYEKGCAVIEMIGEWNDVLNNDIMFFKRDVAEVLMSNGISRFILIGENVLNFHAGDDSYYEEWFDELEDGWICMVNFREHVLQEFKKYNLDYYLLMGGELNRLNWRTLHPLKLTEAIDGLFQKRLMA